MQKLVPCVLALTTTSAIGFANGSENVWTDLDKEIEALSASLSQDGGTSFSGWLRTAYVNSGDLEIDDGDGGTNDLGGFAVPNARIRWEGSRGDYGFFIQYELADGLGTAPAQQAVDVGFNGAAGTDLLDAFITFPIGDTVKGQGRSVPRSRASQLLDGARVPVLPGVDRERRGLA